MQLANFMNEICTVTVEEWQRRLSGRSNFESLKAIVLSDFLAGINPFWFVTENFTNFVYGTILPAVRARLPGARLSAADLVRGVLLHFACREAPPGSYVALIGRLRPSDTAFVDFAKNSAQFVFCPHPVQARPNLVPANLVPAGPVPASPVPASPVPASPVPAGGQLLFDATAATLGHYLRPGTISVLMCDLTTDPADLIRLLGMLAPLQAADTTLIAQGPNGLLHGLHSQLTECGTARMWAQCVIEDLAVEDLASIERDPTTDLHDAPASRTSTPRTITFAYFEMLDKAALPLVAKTRRVAPSTADHIDPPWGADPGPYRYLEREQIAAHAQAAPIFAPARTIPVHPPLFVDQPENAAATWRGQFGVTSQEWLYPKEMSCPVLGCAVFDKLRIIGTEMLVSQAGETFPASQMPMTEAYFATVAALFRADAQPVGGGFRSARAATITQHIRAPSVILANGGLPMHYHFLFDVLPRLWFLRQEALTGFSIALPDTVLPYQVEALTKYYEIDRERIEIYSAERGACLFDRACAAPSMVCDWWAMPETVTAPRSALRHAAPPREARFRDAKRLYVSRRDVVDSRGLVNETELVERLTALGFVEVFPSAFDYDQEMYLFRNAEVVVGPFGSGMANVMFCAPGARAVFLQPDSTNWRIMSFVMGYLELEYGYIFGEAFRRRSRGHNTEWIIDVDAAARRIGGLI